MEFQQPQSMKRDTLFLNQFQSGAFVFDEEVAKVFDDMIHRSIPDYAETLAMIKILADQRLEASAQLTDLGCSTGLLIEKLAVNQGDWSFTGVDSSQSMIEAARTKLGGYPNEIEWVTKDVVSFDLPAADAVFVQYLLQFLPIENRLSLLQSIAFSLTEKGTVFVSEKLKADDVRFQEVTDALYAQFKRDHGYSDDEINHKKIALEGVLVPLTDRQNRSLFREAGFSQVQMLRKNLNFATYMLQV